MKTYLTIWFNSDGGRPSEITEKLKDLGFMPVKGNYDFEYEWDEEAQVDEILSIGDKIQKELKPYKVLFTLETI